MLSKSNRYFADGEAVKERAVVMASRIASAQRALARGASQDGNKYDGAARPHATTSGNRVWSDPVALDRLGADPARNLRDVWAMPTSPAAWDFCGACGALFDRCERSRITTSKADGKTTRACPCGAADAWVSHYAAFPEHLVELMVKIGTSAGGCCGTCGAPWAPVVAREVGPDRAGRVQGRGAEKADEAHGTDGRSGDRRTIATRAFSYRRTCAHDAPARPCVVLDPFAGSGTTGVVAARLGREFVGIDASAAYCRVAEARIVRAYAVARGKARVVQTQLSL